MGIFDRKRSKPEATTEPSPDKTLDEKISDQLRQVYDPEIPVNIFEMGLIYGVDVEGSKAHVRMTLTSPNCPAAQELPLDVKNKVEELTEIETAEVDIVWDPPWDPDMMTDEAKLELGMI